MQAIGSSLDIHIKTEEDDPRRISATHWYGILTITASPEKLAGLF
jgi:hypothetical protein